MKKVIIIGSGIAGLSAGCYLRMNGYDTEIFEFHSQPGGLCAAWKRKDYLIDGCIHWFVGCNPSDGLYDIWDGLVDMKDFPFVVYDEFCSVAREGITIRLYGDQGKLNRQLKAIAPEDSKVIDEFTSAIKEFSRFSFSSGKASEIMTLPEKMMMACKMIPMLLALLKWRIPVDKYAGRFKNAAIRHFLTTSLGSKTPVSILLLNSSWFCNRNAGYPIGGAKGLVDRIVKRYEYLGGKIHYSAKVSKIIVENNTAKGVKLENGQVHNGDIIVSASDGRSTILEMLGGEYRDKNINKLYFSGKYEPKSSGFYISLGVARKFDESYKPYVYFDLKKPIIADGEEIKNVGVTVHNFDPNAAPEGKTILTVLIKSNDPKRWISLRRENKQDYDAKKDALAEEVIDELDAHFGNIKNNLEMVDVATPATYARYTNNWNGAIMGWTDVSLLINKPKKEINGLKNFYMCGQWVADTGLPGAVKSGRDIAQIICRKYGALPH